MAGAVVEKTKRGSQCAQPTKSYPHPPGRTRRGGMLHHTRTTSSDTESGPGNAGIRGTSTILEIVPHQGVVRTFPNVKSPITTRVRRWTEVERGNKLSSQRLGETCPISCVSTAITFAQPKRRLATNQRGLPGTVL